MKKRDGLISYLYEFLYAMVLGIGGFRLLWPFIKEMSPETTFGMTFETEKSAKFVGNVMFVLTIIIACIVFYLIARIITASLWTKIVVCAGVFVTLPILMFAGVHPDKVATDALYTIAVILAADIVQYFWKKEGQTDLRRHVVFLSPLFILFFILLVVLPAPEEKADWSGVIRVYNTVVYQGKKLLARLESAGIEGYGEGVAGFSEQANLLGNVGDNDTVILTVKSSTLKEAPLYLAGKTYDTFTGREWVQSAEGYPNEKAIDALEFISGTNSSYEDSLTDIFKQSTVLISFDSTKSRYMFAPPKTLIDLKATQNSAVNTISNDLMWNDYMGFGTSYELSYLLLNDNAGAIANEPKPIRETAWEAACQKYDYSFLGSINYSTLTDRREYIYETYLENFEVPPKTREIVDLIVGDAETDFEKLNRIASYLRMGDYSTSPGEPDEEIDTPGEFLEYFLTGKTEGFCVHYATAFVLMARMEGIPARYVQGFCVSPTSSGEANVRGNNSHAWPEAYIDNIGWLTFEPTPGFYVETAWETSAEKKQRYENDKAANDAAWEEYLRAHPELSGQLSDASETVTEEIDNERNIYSVLIVILVCGAISIITILCAFALMKNKKYRSLMGRDLVVARSRRNLLMLDCMGYGIETGETLSEYRKRLDKYFSENCTEFIGEYELLIYGKDSYNEAMLDVTQNCMDNLKTELKKEHKRIIYFIRQYYF